MSGVLAEKVHCTVKSVHDIFAQKKNILNIWIQILLEVISKDCLPKDGLPEEQLHYTIKSPS